MTAEYQTLLVEHRGPVGWLINNRPERRNAMSETMREELAVAWMQLDADPAVKVIVHTGAGRDVEHAHGDERAAHGTSVDDDRTSGGTRGGKSQR